MDSNKILLFIVEGPTEEDALGAGLTDLITDNIKFKVMHYDITSDNASSVNNIEKRIKEQAVKKFLAKNQQFTERDICGIVHIVDTDGVYIDDALVYPIDNLDRVAYYTDHIEVKAANYQKILNSRNSKRNIINHLITLSTISIPRGIKVPYEVYYMSSNLDNVIGSNMNATESQKQELSLKFGDENDDAKKLANYFNDPSLAVSGNYMDTWDFIKKDLNSLGRYSNFHLLINKYRKH